jgi:hypothetical protein
VLLRLRLASLTVRCWALFALRCLACMRLRRESDILGIETSSRWLCVSTVPVQVARTPGRGQSPFAPIRQLAMAGDDHGQGAIASKTAAQLGSHAGNWVDRSAGVSSTSEQKNALRCKHTRPVPRVP